MESAVKRVQQKVYGTSAAGKSGVSGSAIKRVQDKVYGGASFTMQEENSYAARLERQKREDAKKTPVQADRGLGGRVQDVFKGIGHRQAEGYAGALEALTEGLGKVGSMLQDRKESKQAAQDRELLAQYRQDLSNATAAGDARAIKDAQLRMKAAERRLELNGSMGDYYDKVTSDTVQGLSNFGDRHDQKAQAAFQKAKSGKGAVGGLLVDAGAGLGDVLGDAAANAVLPGLGTAARVVRSFGHGAEAAEDKGLGIGRQALYGAGSAALGEGVNRLFSGNPILEKATGKGALDDILFPNLGKTLPGRMLKSGIGEGIEEGTENLLDPVVQLLTMGAKNTDPVNLKETGHDALVGALIGSLTGISGPKTDRNAPSQAAGAPQDGGRGVDTTAAQEGVQETGNAVHAGRVTTIKSPYQGVKPVQAQKSTAAVPVDSGSVERAQNRINGARGLEGAMPGKGFKATLKEAYKSVFKPTKGVPVDGVTFEGKPYTVDINKNVPGKVISDQNLTAEKLALLDILPQVVQNGEYVGSGEYVQHGSREKPVVRYDYFETPVEIGGKPYIAKFDVEAYPTVNNYRTHQIAKIDLTQTEGRLAGPAPVPSSAVSGPVEGTRPLNSDSTIAQGTDSVNMTDDGLGAANAGSLNSDYERLQAQSDTFHPDGAYPARPVDVPTTDFDGRNIPKSASTVMGGQATDTATVQMLEQQIADGTLSFDTIHDTDAVASAQSTMKEKGFDGAFEQYRQAVRSNIATKDNTALGQQLLIQAMRSGDTASTAELLTLYTRNSTTAAQAMQAQSIFRKLSPEGQLLAVQKAVSDLNAKYGTDVKVDDVDVADFLNAESDEARQEVTQRIVEKAAQSVPGTFRAKYDTLRYLAMLGNPRTHIRNILGNTFFQAPVAVKNRVGAVVEAAASAVTGGKVERTKSIFGANPFGKLAAECRADWANAKDFLGQSSKYLEGQTSLFNIEQEADAFSNGNLLGRGINKAADLNSRALEAEDTAAKKWIYTQSLAGYLKANGCKSISDADTALLNRARSYAAEEALRNTFNDRNAASDAVSKLGGAIRSDNPFVKFGGYIVEGVMPFKRTPTNIAVRAVEYSPIGAVLGAADVVRGAKSGDMAQVSNGLDRVASGVSGTALMAAGFLAAGAGYVTGGEDEDEKQQGFNDLTGHQNYAFETKNGTSVTLDWLAPEAIPFFVGVELYNQGIDGGVSFDDIWDAVKNASAPMLEMSMLQGLNDTFENAAYAKNRGDSVLGSVVFSALTNYATQIFPTIGGQLERSSEEQRMTTYTDKNGKLPTDLQYTIGKVSQKIPGWDYQQMPYIDAWGRTEESGDALVRSINNLFNPAYVSQVDVDSVEQELQRVKDATGDSGVFPDRAEKSITFDNETHDLTAEQYQKYAKAKGRNSYSMVSGATNSAAYRSMGSGEKAEFIKKMYGYADYKAKHAVFPSYHSDAYSKYEEAEAEGITPQEFYIYKESTSGLTADKDSNGESIPGTKKAKVINAISNLPLSPTEKDWLYLLNYDGKNAQSDLRGMPWNR